MASSLAMSDFLGHETKTGGGKSNFLRGWRKRQPAAVNVFLHRKSPIIALWQHGIPRVFEQKDDSGAVTRRVFGSTWNCLESEAVLVKQYRRDRDTGERLVPPVLCPICRLQEHLRDLYHQGVIGFADPLFTWTADDPSETQVLTYGGMLGQYGSDYLSDDEKAAMKRGKVALSEAWKENAQAKCNYVFVVVDADDAESGVQIAVETTSLGDHVKECIRNQMVSLGAEDGNPITTPYALRWEHYKNAKEFSKKYKCIAMPKVVLTDEVAELIGGEPPDIDGVVKPGNITTLRADLEVHYTGTAEIDWEWVFGPAELAGLGAKDETEAKGEAPPPVPPAAPTARQTAAKAPPTQPAPKPAPAVKPAAPAAPPAQPATTPAPAATSGRKRTQKVEPPPPPPPAAPEPETIACEECGFLMLTTDTKCSQCGAEYELDAEPVAEEAPPPPKPVQVQKSVATSAAKPAGSGKPAIRF